MREPAVESLVRQYLEGQGYSTVARSHPTGPDILATRDGRTLLVEVKGDRPGHQSSPATVHVLKRGDGRTVYQRGSRLMVRFDSKEDRERFEAECRLLECVE